MTIEQNAQPHLLSGCSTPPPNIQITGDGGRVLLTIKPDGTVEGEVADASEAAQIFCERIAHILRSEQRRLGVIEGLKMALKAAEDEKWAQHHVDACERDGNSMPYVYNSACHDISKVIRALIEEQKP